MTKTRKEMKELLVEATLDYATKMRQGAYVELGLNHWGKRRADVLAVTLRPNIVLYEIKSCKADFTTDTKYLKYLRFCNKFYFVCPVKLVPLIKESTEGTGIGIMALGPAGYLHVKVRAKWRPVDPDILLKILARMAWREATYNKKNRPRRTRRYE